MIARCDQGHARILDSAPKAVDPDLYHTGRATASFIHLSPRADGQARRSGAEGYVLDHFSRPAIDEHLAMSQRH